MQKSYENVRDEYIERKKKDKGSVSKKDIAACKKQAAIWYYGEYGKPVKHIANKIVLDKDNIPLRDLAAVMNISDNYEVSIDLSEKDIASIEIDNARAARCTYFAAANVRAGNTLAEVLDTPDEINECQSAMARIVDEAIEEDKINDGIERDTMVPDDQASKQKDLMYVSFKLVHVGGNKNKDFFLEEELISSQFTPQLKPLDWEHGEPNIGTMYLSKYIPETANEPGHIKCATVVYKWKYSQYANEMLKRYDNDQLFFSMETWFTEFECSACHNIYSYKDYDVCSHLMERFTEGNETYRVLHNLIFAGAGVVEHPADTLADSISVAHIVGNPNEKEGKDKMEVTYTEDQLNSLIEAKTTLVQNDLKASADDLNDLKEKHETLATENDQLRSDLDAITKQHSEQTDKLKQVTDEYATFKGEIESTKRLDSRISELTNLGFTLPTDETEAETFVEKLRNADEDSYDLIRQTVSMSVPVVKQEESDPNVTSETEADDNEIDDSETLEETDESKPEVPLGASSQNPTDALSIAQNKIKEILS